MKLQKVYIKNFRGIKELFLDFQGKTNLLIGENDCCKTTILEAVDLCFNGKLEQEDLYNLNLSADNNCIVVCIFDENIKQDAGEGENFNAIVHKTHIENGNTKISQDKYLFYISSNEDLNDYINNDERLTKISNATKKTPAVKQKSIIYYMPTIDLDDPSKSSADKNVFEKVFENLNNNEEIKKILEDYDEKAKQQTKEIFANDNNGIAKILEEIFKIKDIDYEYSGSSSLKPAINIVRKYGDKHSKDLSNIGSGVRKIIKFIARLKFDGQQKSIFLIDEPEQNLHPKFQNLLIDFLKDAEIQCIFTSHSPTFVKHCMNDKNCEVLICEKDGEKVKINNMKDKIEKDYKFLEKHINSQAVANFLAFNEYSTDLHNLLYGLLEEKDKAKLEQGNLVYYKQKKDGTHELQNNKSLSYIIRNLIHHPENKNADNLRYRTQAYLEQSINEMIELLKQV